MPAAAPATVPAGDATAALSASWSTATGPSFGGMRAAEGRRRPSTVVVVSDGDYVVRRSLLLLLVVVVVMPKPESRLCFLLWRWSLDGLVSLRRFRRTDVPSARGRGSVRPAEEDGRSALMVLWCWCSP